jgi:tetratricopeptide (TPR) repeat protein
LRSSFRVLPALLLFLALSGGLRAETDLEQAARLLNAKKYQEAQALLEKSLQADSRNAEAYYLMGKLQKVTNNPRKALEFADKAIQINPGNANYHVLRGNSLGSLAQQANLFKARGFATDGREALEKAVQMEPGNRNAVGALFGWYLNVPALGGGSTAKAEALAVRTRVLDPAMGHYLKGLVLQKQKDPGPAQAEYRLAIAADPKLADAYNALGYVELQMKQVDSALGNFRKQVELNPDSANSFDSLGDGLMAKGLKDEAIQAYRRALALDSKFLASQRHLGVALEQAGRRDEAIQHYRQCAQQWSQLGVPAAVTECKARLKELGVKE